MRNKREREGEKRGGGFKRSMKPEGRRAGGKVGQVAAPGVARRVDRTVTWGNGGVSSFKSSPSHHTLSTSTDCKEKTLNRLGLLAMEILRRTTYELFFDLLHLSQVVSAALN